MSLLKRWWRGQTSDPDTLYIIRDYALQVHNLVQLRSSAMEHDRVEADAIKEAEAERELLDLVKDSTTNFDDCKFGRVVRMGGGRENAKIALDLFLSADGIQQTGDGVLCCILRLVL